MTEKVEITHAYLDDLGRREAQILDEHDNAQERAVSRNGEHQRDHSCLGVCVCVGHSQIMLSKEGIDVVGDEDVLVLGGQ